MLINGKNFDIDSIIKDVYEDKSFIKSRGNGIFLSDNDIEVLEKYNIDYSKYSSLDNLIFDIEEILNMETDIDDLDEISRKLSELNYYNNTNK